MGEIVGRFGPRLARHVVNAAESVSRPGAVVDAIREVLADHPAGLCVADVRKLVEIRVGRKVPNSSVKGALWEKPEFIRIRYGVYRLAG